MRSNPPATAHADLCCLSGQFHGGSYGRDGKDVGASCNNGTGGGGGGHTWANTKASSSMKISSNIFTFTAEPSSHAMANTLETTCTGTVKEGSSAGRNGPPRMAERAHQVIHKRMHAQHSMHCTACTAHHAQHSTACTACTAQHAQRCACLRRAGVGTVWV